MEAGTLIGLSIGNPRRMMAALLRPPRGLAQCVNRVPGRDARGTPTTGCLEANPFTAPCTRTWDTSTCITRCAHDRVATRGHTTATPAARPYTVSRTRTLVSVLRLSGGKGSSPAALPACLPSSGLEMILERVRQRKRARWRISYSDNFNSRFAWLLSASI